IGLSNESERGRERGVAREVVRGKGDGRDAEDATRAAHLYLNKTRNGFDVCEDLFDAHSTPNANRVSVVGFEHAPECVWTVIAYREVSGDSKLVERSDEFVTIGVLAVSTKGFWRMSFAAKQSNHRGCALAFGGAARRRDSEVDCQVVPVLRQHAQFIR